jgi:peptidoglycan/LPS O-acetylase OafA/YrhL
MMKTGAKDRIIAVDFIRACCAIGIIVFHFSCHTISAFQPLYKYANGDWGAILVQVFFSISGGMLYYNYPKPDSLKAFYIRRWKSIFPSFYIAYIGAFGVMAVRNRRLFYQGAPWKLLESLLGMDGYLRTVDPTNYYLIGEWFLGALILMYLAYPVLARLMNRVPVAATIGVTVLFLLTSDFSGWVAAPNQNVVSCLFSFWIGMLLFRDIRILKSNCMLAVSVVAFFLMYIWEMPFNGNIATHIMGIGLLVILFRAGELVMKNKTLAFLFGKIGGISYQIFLLQHLVILLILEIWKVTALPAALVCLALIIVVTVLGATVLYYVERMVRGLGLRS